jgi:hypothetical protein
LEGMAVEVEGVSGGGQWLWIEVYSREMQEEEKRIDLLPWVVVVENDLDDLVLRQHERVGVRAINERIGCVVAG